MAKKKLYDEDGNEVKGKLKKPFYKKVWFWILVLLVLGVAVGGGGDDSDTPADEVAVESSSNKDETSSVEASSEESKEAEEVKEVESVGIGDSVNVGDVKYIVNGVETATNVGGEYGQNSKGTYLLVNVTVTNNGSEALTVDNSLFKLISDGKEFESDSTAGIYANEDSSFFLESINPDLSLTGNVVFDVSDAVVSSTTKQLEVATGFWGTETGLINLQ